MTFEANNPQVDLTKETFFARQANKKPGQNSSSILFPDDAPHYAEITTANLDTDIQSILSEIATNTYHQRYPGVFKNFLQDKLRVNKARTYRDQAALKSDSKIQRDSHGAQHTSRVAIAATAMLGFLKEFGSERFRTEYKALLDQIPGTTQQEKEDRFIKLLQITAFYHDAGRYGDGPDKAKWEAEGAGDCKRLIKKILQNSNVDSVSAEQLSTTFASAILKKDPKGDAKGINHPRGLIDLFLHEGDCLDIMRCSSGREARKNFFSRYPLTTRHYRVEFLELWKDSEKAFGPNRSYVDHSKFVQMQHALIKFTLEWRDLIRRCFDLRTAAPIEIALHREGQKPQFVVINHGTKPQFDVEKKRGFEFHPLEWDLDKAGSDEFPLIARCLANARKPLPAQGPLEAEDDLSLVDSFGEVPTGEHYQALRLSLINLAHNLNGADAHHKTGIEYATATMVAALTNDALSKEQKLEVIEGYEAATRAFRSSAHPNLRAAIAFVAITALSVVLGAAIGMLVGFATGSFTGPVGSILAAFAGFIKGSQTGLIVGTSIASAAVGFGAVGAAITHFKAKHTYYNDDLKNVVDLAELAVRTEPVAAK